MINKRNTKESLIVYDEEWNTLDDLCELLNQLQQRIAELEEQLENAIVPKFKIGQEVWYIDRYGVQKDIIVSFTYFSIENEILYKMNDEIIDHREKYIFATKEEAEQKLNELKGKVEDE